MMDHTFASCDASSGPLLQKLGWDKPFHTQIRFKLVAIEMFKVYDNVAPKYLCQKFFKRVHL